ncbi:Gustatory receptor 52c [Halyomorpha halys]|nr:Gustatory receptor 52c [Halyomorpha halys]
MLFRKITQAIKSNFIFRVSSLLGIFPFSMIKNELKVKKSMLLYSIIVSIFLSVVFIYPPLYQIFIAIDQNEADFNYLINILVIILRGITFLLISYFFYFHRNLVIEAVDSMDYLEIFFSKLEGEIKTRPVQKSKLIETFLPPIACGAIFCFGDNSRKYFFPLTYTFMLVEISLSCGQFISFVDTMSDYLQSGSKFLLRLKYSVSFANIISLEKLIIAVSKLVSTSNRINIIYSQQLLFSIFTCYSSIMIHLYFIIINVNSNDEWKHPLILGNVFHCLYQFFVVWRLASSSSQANYKSKEFNTLLYQLMIEDKTNQFIHNDKLRLHISMKREVVFTACGFFNLDYTLVHSMIASATTYLVILIQFGQPVNMAQDLRPHVVFTNSTTPLPLSFTTPL